MNSRAETAGRNMHGTEFLEVYLSIFSKTGRESDFAVLEKLRHLELSACLCYATV